MVPTFSVFSVCLRINECIVFAAPSPCVWRQEQYRQPYVFRKGSQLSNRAWSISIHNTCGARSSKCHLNSTR